jgi:DNA-binding MarR family transcriptional regulator
MLNNNNGGISAGDICETICCDKALISRTLKDLSEKGYVCRNPEDSQIIRGYRIILTEKGWEIAKKFDEYAFAKLLTKGISQEELEQYYKTSEHISDNLYELVNHRSDQSDKPDKSKKN